MLLFRGDAGIWLPNHLLLTPAQQFLCRRVPDCDQPSGVRRNNWNRRGINAGFIGFPKRFRGPFLRRYIARNSRHSDTASHRIENDRYTHRNIKKSAVFGGSHGLVGMGSGAILELFSQERKFVVAAWRNEKGYVFADGFLGSVAVHQLRAFVPARDVAIK